MIRVLREGLQFSAYVSLGSTLTIYEETTLYCSEAQHFNLRQQSKNELPTARSRE